MSFSGTISTTFVTYSNIQAMATAVDGGTSVGWTNISGYTGNSWSGSLTLTPGSYTVSIRAINSNGPSISQSVTNVGVGEIFIMAGQSLFGNFGQTENTPSDPRVVAVNFNGSYHFATDPQPINYSGGASGNGFGSCVPAMGSYLASYLNMPVAFLVTSVQGTSSTQWVSTYYASNLEPAIALLGYTQFRAILWEQGQQDGVTGATAATYESNLASMISSSRSYAGWTVPWGIANASTEQSLTQYPVIQGAQAAVVSGNTSCFSGSNSDSIVPDSDRFDGTHFNSAGQTLQGQAWATAIISYFGF